MDVIVRRANPFILGILYEKLQVWRDPSGVRKSSPRTRGEPTTQAELEISLFLSRRTPHGRFGRVSIKLLKSHTSGVKMEIRTQQNQGPRFRSRFQGLELALAGGWGLGRGGRWWPR
jgi:hypothetical protein